MQLATLFLSSKTFLLCKSPPYLLATERKYIRWMASNDKKEKNIIDMSWIADWFYDSEHEITNPQSECMIARNLEA